MAQPLNFYELPYYHARHMRLFLRNLLFAVLAAVILTKVFLWYRVSQAVERVEAMVVPLGALTHSDVSASFSGDVTISDIRFIPNNSDGSGFFSTNELIVHTPGVHYLLGLGGTLGNGMVPERLGLSLDGLRIGTEAGSRGASMSISGNPFESLGCGGLDFFAPVDLQSMGYSLLTPRVTARYTVPPSNDQLEIVIESKTRRVSNLRLVADLVVPGLEATLIQQGPPSVSLGGFVFSYKDAAFNERRNEYCAELINVPEVTYLDEHLNLVESSLLRRRIRPGPNFLSRYRQLMAPGAELEIWSNLDKPIDLDLLQSTSLENLVATLGLSFRVNGVEGDSLDLTFNVEPPLIEAQPAEVATGQSTAEPAARVIAPSSRPDPSRSLRDTPVNEIGRFVGSQVVINTSTGRLYQGYVDEVSSNGRVMLTITQRGGTAKVPINIDQIDRLRVFR